MHKSGVCVHVNEKHTELDVKVTVHDTLMLQTGKLVGAKPGQPVIVTLSSTRVRPLPLWLRLYEKVATHWCGAHVSCPGTAQLEYVVPYNGTGIVFTAPEVEFDEWQLQLPYLSPVPLQHLIGILPVRVTVQQGGNTFVTLTVQRIRYCVQIGH